MNCYVHQDRPATKVHNVPCAPGGKIHVCDECNTEEGKRKVFEKYKASHGNLITRFKAVRGDRNN